MNDISRREIIKMGLGVAGLATLPDFLRQPDYKPLLSFSTLGCPTWSFPQILDFAVTNKYQGIELRGILGQLDLTQRPEFNSPAKILESMEQVRAKNLHIVDLGSSTELHHADPVERKRHMDEARRFIDLAQRLGCPYIRVFPNKLPKGPEREATIDLIIRGLVELGDYARQTNVTVLMESHGDAVRTLELKHIMETVAHPGVGLVWDVVNMWSVTKEPPANVYAQLKPYIHHTHIKDLTIVDGKERYVLLGKGQAPIFEAIDLLSRDKYPGYFSFEWEKLWHPEIDEPEIALADYPKAMMRHFAKG